MKEYLISKLIEALLSALGPDEMEKAVDFMLDMAENKAAEMDPGPYRNIVESLCRNIRDAFHIEDNDI